MSIIDILESSIKTFEDRNKVYGSNYVRHGRIMHAMFPEGLTLKTVEDFNRFAIIEHIVGKVGRYVASMEAGGHRDSAHDIIVYAAILEQLTKESQSD